jgi:threonine/homoserine/homoserine lactone efflux protein
VGEAFGTVLPLAAAIAVFPVPVIAVVLLLGSNRGRAKAVAFVLAWAAGLAAVGAAVLLLAAGVDASESGEPATWVSVLLLALGLLLLALAVKQWRGRPASGEDAPVPGWMLKIDGFTSVKAGATGFALSALNPKNALRTAAAAVEIGGVGITAGQQIAVLVGFVLVASAGVLAPLVLAVALGDRSAELLDALRGWMARHNAAIMAVLFFVIGAKLVGDAVSGLSG